MCFVQTYLKSTNFCALFECFLIQFWMVFGALQWRYIHFWTFIFSEKAPRVESNPRATSAVLLRALANGEYHRATAAVAG